MSSHLPARRPCSHSSLLTKCSIRTRVYQRTRFPTRFPHAPPFDIQPVAMRLTHVASWTHACLFRRPQKEDRRSHRKAKYEKERGRPSVWGEPLLSQALREEVSPRKLAFVRQKAPGKRPKVNERARRLLEADRKEQPFASSTR